MTNWAVQSLAFDFGAQHPTVQPQARQVPRRRADLCGSVASGDANQHHEARRRGICRAQRRWNNPKLDGPGFTKLKRRADDGSSRASTSPARQHLKRRQGFAFKHFQEGTAASTDVTHLFLNAVFGNGGQGIATTRY